ncbi:MAG: hypothetical protein ABIR67_02825 [Gaiellaceae bacterium]
MTARHGARLDALSQLDLVLLFVVVFDMALKPTADDVGTLLIGGAAMLAAVFHVARVARTGALEAAPASAP